MAEHKALFKDSPPALKALGYVYQSLGRWDKANEVFKEVYVLRPQYAQSFMDIANSYREVGYFRKAAAIYTRYDYLTRDSLMRAKDEGFHPIIQREFYNHLAIEGKNFMNITAINHDGFDEFTGTRLVFEWNDSEVEFELQFVNLQMHYYTWAPSYDANPDRIRDEKLKGYSCQEYLIEIPFMAIGR